MLPVVFELQFDSPHRDCVRFFVQPQDELVHARTQCGAGDGLLAVEPAVVLKTRGGFPRMNDALVAGVGEVGQMDRGLPSARR